ncbi:MAG: hypothetical protein JWN14_2280 [Chthonomonadales bacterium]|nr:hypothetical protein [Chthonomonadales bacterium]
MKSTWDTLVAPVAVELTPAGEQEAEADLDRARGGIRDGPDDAPPLRMLSGCLLLRPLSGCLLLRPLSDRRTVEGDAGRSGGRSARA